MRRAPRGSGVRLVLPREGTPALTTLALLNLAVFLAWQVALSAGGPFPSLMALVFTTDLDLVRYGLVWTLLGSAISHVNIHHLLFNMLAMWVFGRDVERVVGSAGFLHLYIAGGIVASLGHVAYNAISGDVVPALGASGSVMAIAVVSAMLFPNRLLLLFFFIPMRQITAVTMFVLLDVFGLISPSRGVIAHAAHLGGAVYGLLYYRYRLRHYLEARLKAWRRQRDTPTSPWDHPTA